MNVKKLIVGCACSTFLFVDCFGMNTASLNNGGSSSYTRLPYGNLPPSNNMEPHTHLNNGGSSYTRLPCVNLLALNNMNSTYPSGYNPTISMQHLTPEQSKHCTQVEEVIKEVSEEQSAVPNTGTNYQTKDDGSQNFNNNRQDFNDGIAWKRPQKRYVNCFPRLSSLKKNKQ